MSDKLLLQNPFVVSGYRGDEYFCDRAKETTHLIDNMINGNSTTIISIRRIGKTGLIRHALEQLPENWQGIYIDILETENLTGFLNLLATSILTSVPEKSSIWKKCMDFVKSLRPIIGFDPLTGAPQASFDITDEYVVQNIDATLKFLETLETRIVIAIDEFQQILSYPEKNTDAWLRTRIQQMKNVVFIFSGSQQHLMAELFSLPKRPFYRSTQIMKLDKIDQQTYCDFILSMFEKGDKIIAPETAHEILGWTNTHTFYVQSLCNRVFSSTVKTVTTELWKQQASELIQEQEIIFWGYRNILTRPQWNLLKSIAHEKKVYLPTAHKFIDKFRLGSSATVLRSLKSLVKYEMIYYDFDSEGKKFYCVYDVFFQKWSEGK